MNINTSHYVFKTILFTGLALIAFAANSVLCRLALKSQAIDAASFTIIRLFSGALILLFIMTSTRAQNEASTKGSWFGSFMLFLYATTFSFAYIELDTGTGALILFGAVQITMILMSVISGNRLYFSEWLGVIISFIGFSYLILPSINTPSITGLLLMTIAGIAWAFYTLKGRESTNPLSDTSHNFIKSIPFVIILAAITIKNTHYSNEGILLAVLSGGIASGIGYAIWYNALRGLSAIQAAVVQLLVPVIAAIGGILFVSETITIRLVVSAVMIFGGILMVLLGRQYFMRPSNL